MLFVVGLLAWLVHPQYPVGGWGFGFVYYTIAFPVPGAFVWQLAFML